MKRAFLMTVTAAIALSAPALATHRPGHQPGNSANLSAATTPTPIVFGAATTVSGKLTGQNNGGRQVTLAEDPFPYGDGYVNVTTVNTTANGDYSFANLRPASNRNYRVSVGSEQAFTGVRVRMRVSFSVSDSTPRRGQRVAFSGFVAPKHDGATVLVQRLSATGAWITVRRTLLRATTGDRSRYRTVLTIRRSGSYRTRIGAHGDHLAGTSRVRILRVS